MPQRLRGSMHYAFNRVIAGVGRLQHSSGTASRKEFTYRDGLLTKLAHAGALDTLRLFKAGRLTIQDLVDADRRGVLEHVAHRLMLTRPLVAAVEAWLPQSAAAPASRRRYRTSWSAFLSKALAAKELPRDALVADLARIQFRRLRTRWQSAADWNRARAAVSAFLTAYLGEDRYHPFRLDIMRRWKAQAEPRGRLPELSAHQFWAIVQAADPRCAPAYVAMATLAVGPAEYLALIPADLQPDTRTVHVRGTKTVERDGVVAVDPRLWPWIERAVPSRLQYRWLNTYWHRACAIAGVEGVRMYDLRHLSGQLAGDQGATDRDLTIHLRHASASMSHRYSRRRTAQRVAQAVADGLLEGQSA